MAARSRPSPEAEQLSLRSFYVHLSGGPAGGGHLVTDAGDAFEAAMLFAERWGPDAEDADELRVHVVDGFTGERCCYVINLGNGEVGPC